MDEDTTLKLEEASIHAGDDGTVQVRFDDKDRETWDIAPGDVERLYDFLKERRAVGSGIG